MTIEKAVNLFNNLTKTINKFKSPGYKSYFLHKSVEDFGALTEELKKGRYSCVIKKYIEEQSELLDILKRQTVIYNMYRDDNNTL